MERVYAVGEARLFLYELFIVLNHFIQPEVAQIWCIFCKL